MIPKIVLLPDQMSRDLSEKRMSWRDAGWLGALAGGMNDYCGGERKHDMSLTRQPTTKTSVEGLKQMPLFHPHKWDYTPPGWLGLNTWQIYVVNLLNLKVLKDCTFSPNLTTIKRAVIKFFLHIPFPFSRLTLLDDIIFVNPCVCPAVACQYGTDSPKTGHGPRLLKWEGFFCLAG